MTRSTGWYTVQCNALIISSASLSSFRAEIYQNKSPNSFAIVNLWQFWRDTLLRSVLHSVREKTWYCYKSLFNNLIFHNFKKVDIKITNNLELTLPSARNIFPMKKIIFSAGLMRMMLLVFRDRIFSCIVRSPFKDSSGL